LASGVLFSRRDPFVGPNAVFALVSVKRAKWNSVSRTEADGVVLDLWTKWLAVNLAADTFSCFREKVPPYHRRHSSTGGADTIRGTPWRRISQIYPTHSPMHRLG